MTVTSRDDLRGVRVWLSASVPEDATPHQSAAIEKFIRGLAKFVFNAGGHILHGSHPSVVPILLREAHSFIAEGGRHDCLILAVSRFWSKRPDSVPIKEWRETCTVYETEEAEGPRAREESLDILRRWMGERCDVFIGVGGSWWNTSLNRAGVPIEAGLAFEKGAPSFLLGGLGGAARTFLDRHAEILNSLKNGLSSQVNGQIALNESVDECLEQVCEQILRLPLVRGRVAEGISFRILALDGGGIKGAYTAAVLARLEKALGTSVSDHFDLVAGTSTGGILAIALGMGISPDVMLSFYRERGPKIFPVTSFHRSIIHGFRHFLAPKYSQNTLFRELQNAYFPLPSKQKQSFWRTVQQWFSPEAHQMRALGDSKCRLVIPAYDAVSGACHTFRTPHNPLLMADADTNVAEVALATAAAPTYFSSAKVRNMLAQSTYVDGGVWANTPAMAAIIEAVCYLNVPLDRIDVLSIGTTDEPFEISSLGRAGVLRWNKNLIDLLMNAQMQSSLEHAKRMVGEPRFLRINTITRPGFYSLDGVREIESLISRGDRAASDPVLLTQVKSRFLNGVKSIPWKQ